ncbi:hypothetical protein B0J11DRAFT_46958 [Dendryphion nanum]|uniref:Zn(2)-C6 fungal-type domain-containing protein n=1 Tax=Dendryphion nanum TaxID=256645 RepID=A0A9P9EKZ7_9PLEO|nr:hypothetical protein B0J11DRAFT_46958 [Dendryphion nanum]
MPAERLRTSANIQGRQKSCSECAKAKRRCDLGLPLCLRCEKQRLTCAYPPPRAHSTTFTSTCSLDNVDAPNLLADEAFLFETPDEPSVSSDDVIDLLDFDFPAATASVDALNEMLIADINDAQPLARSASSTIFDESNYLPGKQFSAANIAPAARSRIDYAMEQLKLAPALMVQEFRTHWCHPNLYEDEIPRCIQDVQAACALYLSRTEKNTTIVARHVIQRSKELLEASMPSSPLLILARAQALILYQIMHIFSGEMAYCSHADAAIQKLHGVSIVLNDLVLDQQDPSGSLPLFPSSDGRAAWKSYIFRESARRTLLILVHLVAVCNLFRGWLGTCSQAVVAGNRVTFSAHLWNAANAFDFVVAWNEKSHHVIKEMDFAELLDNGRPDDVDTFGKMILTSVLGIDDVKGWFHVKGSSL